MREEVQLQTDTKVVDFYGTAALIPSSDYAVRLTSVAAAWTTGIDPLPPTSRHWHWRCL